MLKKKKNPVQLYDDSLLFHESEDWFGLGSLLVLQENDVEPCDLGSFNSTNNRNGKSCRILKLRKRVFFVLGVTSVSYNMVAVEQLKVAGGTEELNVLFYFNDVYIATCIW